MFNAHFVHRRFHFKQPSGTSRGILTTKDSWFLVIEDKTKHIKGVGECSVIEGLSPDNIEAIPDFLSLLCAKIRTGEPIPSGFFDEWPAVGFCYELGMLDVKSGGNRRIYETDFLTGKGIPINGLIWMGNKDEMIKRIKQKIDQGFRCLKMKIGALDFNQELDVLKHIRTAYAANDLELRVDANGAFKPDSALDKLNQLAEYDLHSIEQPIAAGQWEAMSKLSKESPVPIALDEELISRKDSDIEKLLDTIDPHYIILKPSLLGGFAKAKKWINAAESRDINWWVTSALESNIGLNGIAQWTATLNNELPQGLGTGQLYTDNIVSPLDIINAQLVHTEYGWEIDFL